MTSARAERRPTCLLVTGFGRFPGAPINPTAALVASLARSPLLRRAELRIATHVFATRYAAVDAELPALIARARPDALIMFGVALRAKHVRIELFARNRKSVLFPDASGAAAVGLAITPGAPAALRGRFALPAVLAALRATGLRAVVSRDAGRYLCNYLYWRALEQGARPDGPRIVAFVHVPPVALKPRPRRPGANPPRPKPDDLAHAGEALLACVAAMARRRVT